MREHFPERGQSFRRQPAEGRSGQVGAKYDIYCIINELAASGKCVLVISSELPELLGVCDRIYVMNEGEIKGEKLVQDATQENIMRLLI